MISETRSSKQIVWAGIAHPRSDTSPQSDFGVCVEGNRILETGRRQQLLERFPDAEQIGSRHLLLAPATINSHDHGRGLGTASFGVPDDLLEIWLLHLGTQPSIDPYLAAAYDGLQLLKSGVGTVAHSHNPRSWQTLETEAIATIQGYRDVGIRVAFHPPIVNQHPLAYDTDAFRNRLPPELKARVKPANQPPPLSADDYFALCRDLHHSFHDREQHTVHIQVSPAGGQWCSDELILRAVEFAQHHQTRVQMHLLETRYQRQYAYRRWNRSFVKHLDEIGALGPWLTCAHMVWVDPEDLPLLAERGVGIAHNPSSNLRLRSGVAPVAAMLSAGIQLGIGLDGHGLDDDQDYLREMRLAWTLANQPGASSSTVDAQSILKMGTLTGKAITLGKEVLLGELREGYLADLILIDWDAVRGLWPSIPSKDGLLHKASARHIKHVMVNGEWVIWEGKARSLNETELVERLRENLAQQNSEELRKKAKDSLDLSDHLRDFYADWDREN